MSLRQGNDVIAGGNVVRIDSALNAQSVNPVQNKAVATAVNTISGDIETIGGQIETINTTLAGKQDAIGAGNGITINDTIVSVGNLDAGTMS